MNTKFYFDHDYGARNDDRILELRAEFGWEGYGIFWGLIEMICENDGKIQSQALAGLAVGLGVAKARLEAIINLCLDKGLLYSNKGFIRSKRVDAHFERRKKLSEAGRRGGQANKDGESEATLKPGLSHPEAKKGKESIEEKIKDKNVEPDFIDRIIFFFMDEYKKSRGFDFVVSNKGKERSAIGKLITLHRQSHPDLNTEQSLAIFANFFKKCMDIKEEWLRTNMSPSTIYSQYNKIRTILKDSASEVKQPEILKPL